MKFDVSDYIKKKSMHKDLDFDIDLDGFDFGNDFIKVIEPIRFESKLDLLGGLLELTGFITGTIELTCSRCLVHFPYKLNIKVDEKFSNNTEIVNNSEDVTFIDNALLDITEIVLGNIILSLPSKNLCTETCKGLCPHCGEDLNVSTCNCEVIEIDPRLAKLKNYLAN